MTHNERILLDCLNKALNSLEYVDRTHPGLSGIGVRQEIVKEGLDIIEEITTSVILVNSPAQLMLAMTSAASAPYVTIEATIGGVPNTKITGYLCAVERESGGGKCFNVSIRIDGVRQTKFVRFS